MQPHLLCFEKLCDYCGATLEITAAELGGEPRIHLCGCPDCGKSNEVACAGNPHVRLVKRRTDGKTSKYQDTFF